MVGGSSRSREQTQVETVFPGEEPICGKGCPAGRSEGDTARACVACVFGSHSVLEVPMINKTSHVTDTV